jgi:hypothetical protein
MKITHIDTSEFGDGLPLDKNDVAVTERHHEVAAIIARHLKEIRQEIMDLDPGMMNLDQAGDRAEIARQVLTALVDQLRNFASDARQKIAEDKIDPRAQDEMRQLLRELVDHQRDGVPVSQIIASIADPGVPISDELQDQIKHLGIRQLLRSLEH